jgi:D-serine dehydratase
MDQHAILELDDAEVEVGDIIGFSIGNEFRPSFATWRTVPLVDDAYDVIDLLDIYY